MGSCCGGASVASINYQKVEKQKQAEVANNEDCPYNNTNLNDYKEKLNWFKNKALYVQYGVSASLLNKYLGIVLTSLNISKKCTYQLELNKIRDLVSLITSIQITL